MESFKFKKLIFWLIKLNISSLIALVVLNVFCFFYYNIAVHSTSESSSTDYVFQKNRFYSRGTEGYAYGKTDAKGYNNSYPLNENEIDILLMGSSHMEGFNILQKYNTAYKLNEYFNETANPKNVYNIGTSGHTLVRCLNNLESAYSEFNPSEYIIIETDSIQFNIDDLDSLNNNEMSKLSSAEGGITSFLQHIPYLRLINTQYQSIKSSKRPSKKSDVPLSKYEIWGEYYDSLNLAFKRAGEFAKNNNFRLLFFSHSKFKINKDASITFQTHADFEDVFKELCYKNDILYINMNDEFLEQYNKNYTVPYGFSNTTIGVGHLNTKGHQIISQKLFEFILETEN